ncbi:MAG TPA: NAD(P)-dependent oxidoreductase [Phycisphaerae bacterium]|nr:NAD(P)-dependent oxidoreductase [Phycisphaerae bacterium]
MPSDRFDILVAEPLEASAMDRLAEVGEVRSASNYDPATLIREVAGADALIVRTYSRVTAAVIEAGDRLKVIGRAGVGLENIDLAAARERGITVVYTPQAGSQSVAEHTVGLMLALERRLATGEAMLREGRFAEARRTLVGREFRGLTLGIVGMGRIGRRVARMCRRAFDMTVLYNDIVEIGYLDFVATPVSKERVWAESDVISLHVPLTELTRHLVNAEALKQFQPAATLINTARGAVVDAAALAAALAAGELAGAAIDVHEPEPPPPDYPLLGAPNVLLSPHIAARTTVARARMNDVVDDVIAALTGDRIRYPAHED